MIDQEFDDSLPTLPCGCLIDDTDQLDGSWTFVRVPANFCVLHEQYSEVLVP
jgi:hypothetical protein